MSISLLQRFYFYSLFLRALLHLEVLYLEAEDKALNVLKIGRDDYSFICIAKEEIFNHI